MRSNTHRTQAQVRFDTVLASSFQATFERLTIHQHNMLFSDMTHHLFGCITPVVILPSVGTEAAQ